MKTSFLVALAALLLCSVSDAQVLVNEFNSGTPDFIELINGSQTPASVAGWTVSTWYATSSAGLTTETPFTIPTGTTIAPGGFLVLQENGIAGAPGTLPSSMSVGINYLWTGTRTVEIDMRDATSAGVDYVLYDPYGIGTIHNGTPWSGTFTGSSDAKYRNVDGDTDTASDWSVTSGSGTPGALNPGQFGVPQPEIVVTVTTNGLGSLQWDVTTANPAVPNAEIYNFVSLQDFQPDGSGPFFGVGFDVLNQVAAPLSPTGIFHTLLDGSGNWSISIPSGVPMGIHAEFVSILLGPSPIERISPVDSIDF